MLTIKNNNRLSTFVRKKRFSIEYKQRKSSIVLNLTKENTELNFQQKRCSLMNIMKPKLEYSDDSP
jgi:hypothetical protein